MRNNSTNKNDEVWKHTTHEYARNLWISYQSFIPSPSFHVLHSRPSVPPMFSMVEKIDSDFHCLCFTTRNLADFVFGTRELAPFSLNPEYVLPGAPQKTAPASSVSTLRVIQKVLMSDANGVWGRWFVGKYLCILSMYIFQLIWFVMWKW